MHPTLPELASPLACLESSTENTDDLLIEQALREPAAFADIYNRHILPVYRYLYTRVSATADAEDLTTQVFLAALEALPRYRPGGSFRAWLFGIARRKAADFFRKRARLVPLECAEELPAASGDPLALAAHNESLRVLARITARLDADERELLRLRFAGQLSFREIAHLLGRQESAVKMSLYRLLDKLEKQMEAGND